MAWPDEAQAEATVKVGPSMPNTIDKWLAGAEIICLGMVRG